MKRLIIALGLLLVTLVTHTPNTEAGPRPRIFNGQRQRVVFTGRAVGVVERQRVVVRQRGGVVLRAGGGCASGGCR